MTLRELHNLTRVGQLKAEAGTQVEFDGLMHSGRVRLHDAKNTSNSLESRFDLAYNAAHALSLAALRWHGFRSENRWTDPSVRLSAPTMRSLVEVFQFQQMSKVQAATLDNLLRGDDVFAKAKTGECCYARLFPRGGQ